jgi:hypothetical protein
MKPIVAGVLASIAALGLWTACGDDPVKTLPTSNTIPTEVTFPGGITIPEDITIPDDVTIPEGDTVPAGIPSDASIPEALIDQMIAQFEAAGMNVDKECFTNLLSDESLRNLVTAGGAPSQEVMQKFFACIKA